MQAAKATFETVHAALAQGLDGFRMSSGELLTATSQINEIDRISGGNIPCLQINSGSWTSDEWSQFQSIIKWDLPCELRVRAEAQKSGEAMRAAMLDLLFAISMIRGLPVDEDGKVRPYSTETLKLSREDKLDFLATRSGPIVKSFKVRPESDSSYSTADVSLYVEFIADHKPDNDYRRVSVVSLGVSPFDVARTQTSLSQQGDLLVPVMSSDDIRAQGAFVEPDTVVRDAGPNGPILTVSDPPNAKVHMLAGGDPAKTVVSLALNPASVTLAALATQQLIAIAGMADGSVQTVTGGASYGTSDGTKATVSSGGLITAVATGSATITATFSGYSATCAVTVS